MSILKTIAVACALTPLAHAGKNSIASRQNVNTTCTDIHYFKAQGTTLPYPGSLITVLDPLMRAFPRSNYEDIVYPATDEEGSDGYSKGVQNSAKQINFFAEACPESQIVLMGYSQGALVLGDILAGRGDNSVLRNLTQPLVKSCGAGRQISAILLYGNPRHLPNQTYNVGNVSAADATSKYPRTATQVTDLSKYANRICDFCNFHDRVCDARGNDLSAHLAHSADYNAEAVAWSQSKL
ncbi:Acetylxylan esterase 2 [Colletotrichum shisoi]|uniref:Acetylxylan esterase 2 n=1 Tax=Colletotrichum shisoi TaxID=2078593 RepID=A0A5Q4BY91_9PEZI|nr:Acetylxylan esterase 2 [Colletotrichum shisoi]